MNFSCNYRLDFNQFGLDIFELWSSIKELFEILIRIFYKFEALDPSIFTSNLRVIQAGHGHSDNITWVKE